MESLKHLTDIEIVRLFLGALDRIRATANGYGEIRITVSGGKVKFMTVEIPVTDEMPKDVS